MTAMGTSPVGPPSPEPTFRHALRHLTRAFHARFRVRLTEQGVSEPEYQGMFTLRRIPDMSSADLARWLGVTPQAANIVVHSLEHKGLVERVPSPSNGRVLRARLTEAGMGVIKMCEGAAEEVQERMLSDLDAAERRQFDDFIRRGASALGSPVPTAALERGSAHPTPK